MCCAVHVCVRCVFTADLDVAYGPSGLVEAADEAAADHPHTIVQHRRTTHLWGPVTITFSLTHAHTIAGGGRRTPKQGEKVAETFSLISK